MLFDNDVVPAERRMFSTIRTSNCNCLHQVKRTEGPKVGFAYNGLGMSLGLVFLLCVAYSTLIEAFLFGRFNLLEIKQNLKWPDLISKWVETVTSMIILAICAHGIGMVL